jgi:hypothetical protein
VNRAWTLPPEACSTSFTDNAEGLSARVIRESSERSRDRLGVARLDLLYAHIEDPAVPLAETVEAFAALVAEGTVGPLLARSWGRLAGDVGGGEPGPRDRAEDDDVEGEREQAVPEFRPRDRYPQQRVERQPPVRRQVRVDHV